MNTEDLIRSLSSDVRPVRRYALGRRIAAGMIGGGLISLLVVGATLGVRPDLFDAMEGFAFWMKWTYAVSLTILAIAATTRLAQPEILPLPWLWLLCVPVLLLAGIGVGELATTPSDLWMALWLGQSWMVCPWLVLGLSLPIFLGLLWSFRRLAPTRLRAAGATAGLAAGACAASIYCLHCPEASALFVLTWYSLGIALATGFGALVGPRFLRW
ncbi:DUF1109 domain-containing protein [Sphingomonas sp.]|uniref:DUF1109 domain-containing protein n=1 Tax=Sphingomonas sp. TaxID=28214 RepID=UPI003B3A087A